MFEPVVATLITSMARTVTGARSLWLGCAPVPVQRIYFANHSSQDRKSTRLNSSHSTSSRMPSSA